MADFILIRGKERFVCQIWIVFGVKALKDVGVLVEYGLETRRNQKRKQVYILGDLVISRAKLNLKCLVSDILDTCVVQICSRLIFPAFVSSARQHPTMQMHKGRPSNHNSSITQARFEAFNF